LADVLSKYPLCQIDGYLQRCLLKPFLCWFCLQAGLHNLLAPSRRPSREESATVSRCRPKDDSGFLTPPVCPASSIGPRLSQHERAPAGPTLSTLEHPNFDSGKLQNCLVQARSGENCGQVKEKVSMIYPVDTQEIGPSLLASDQKDNCSATSTVNNTNSPVGAYI
jgi:hypothetical protein